VLDDIRLAHHAAASSTLNTRQVHAFFGGQASRGRRRSHFLFLSRGWRGWRGWGWRCWCRLYFRGWFRLGRGCRLSRRALRRRRLIEFTQHRAQRHHVAFLMRTPDEYAAGCRGHLDRYLIRLELDERFPGRHGFTFAFEPA
jgi:hypothetical protein